MSKNEFTDLYGSSVGSFVISYSLLNKKSKFSIMRSWKRMNKKQDFPWTEDYVELIHRICIYFGLDEDKCTGIVGVITDYGTLVFVPFVDKHLVSILPNFAPFGAIQHPKKVFDLKGNEINDYYYFLGLRCEEIHVVQEKA